MRERTAQLEQASLAARESEERFRGLFENSVVGIYRTTLDGDIQIANQALADMLGYSSVEELTQRNLEQSGFEPDNPRLQFKELMERQGYVKGLESVWKRRDGTTILVRESARRIRDKQEKSIYFEGTVEDITQRRQAEDALRNSEQFLAQSQQVAHLGSWTVDLETGKITWSDELYRIYGVSPDVFVPTESAFLALIHPDERSAVRSWMSSALSGNKAGHHEFRAVRPDGTIRVIEGDGQARVNAENKPILLFGTAQDITERLQLEAQFRQAQKMESVGQLASGIAHDFNNLLTVINGMSELLLAQVSHDDPVHTDVEEILHAGERAATLTRQLLAFSRQQILEPRVLNVHTVVAGWRVCSGVSSARTSTWWSCRHQTRVV